MKEYEDRHSLIYKPARKTLIDSHSNPPARSATLGTAEQLKKAVEKWTPLLPDLVDVKLDSTRAPSLRHAAALELKDKTAGALELKGITEKPKQM